ncbi:MAG: hypothetical protein R3A51_08180 [Nannocystaceae bacterium]
MTDSPRAPFRPSRRALVILILLALATRLLWVLWLHPPTAFVYSDMGGYVKRAVDLAEQGFVPGTRHLAWQAYGTHYLLGAILKIIGTQYLYAAGLFWGLMGAAAVPITYLLACRVCTRPWMPLVVGIAALCWYPNLSTSGFFLSEPPALFFGSWATLRLVILLQDGKGAWHAGIVSALAFTVRPQLALFFVLTVGLWLLVRKRPEVRARLPHVAIVGACLAAIFAFSMWRFHEHTGEWGGIAEAANANNTASRCHNPRTQVFANKRLFDRSHTIDDGRLIGIIPFQTRFKKVSHDSFLGMRPALGTKEKEFTVTVERRDGKSEVVPVKVGNGGWSIKFVGYIGDREIHRALQKLCVRETGLLEQLRYGLVNLTGLWIYNAQWPDSARHHKLFGRYAVASIWVFNLVILLPSLLGLGLALARARQNPGLAICALQLVGLFCVSAYFFGSIRLRTPYDVYAIILAVEGYGWIVALVRRKLGRAPVEATATSSTAASE